MPFSDDYFRLFEDAPAFHERVEGRYRLDSGSGRISERLLRCIWYDRLYRKEKLSTIDGRMVEVHSPGTWNLEGGPDFRRAEITIGDVRLKGDVELHIDPAGWRLHRHSGDPEYDNVILHVTLMPRRKMPDSRDLPATRHGVEIAEVALWDCLDDDLKLLKCALRPDEYPYGSTENFGKCRGLLEQLPSETSQKLLCIAGDARMIAKQRRFSYESEESDLDQVAYGAVLEGMGYKAHTKQFGRLARRLPYALLCEQARASGEKGALENGIRLTQALLLGAASLLPVPDSGDTPEVREYLSLIGQLWRAHGFSETEDGDFEWKRAPVRPANLPERRLAGAGHVLARTYEVGFFDAIMARILRTDPKEARKECIEFLTPAEDGFWSYRYSPHGKRLDRPVSLLGRSRAMTIIANSFIPLGLLHARTHGTRDDEERVFQFYAGFPSLPPNNITRLMEFKMFGNSPKERAARSARAQQGLLQIFADWCSEDPSCQNCGIFSGLQSGYIRDKVADIHA
jgi:hypothetical protein